MNGDNPFEPFIARGLRYQGMKVYSVYLPMRDGVRLAADVYLPGGLPSGERIPTILYQTRYWRSVELRPPLRWLMRGEGDVITATRKGKEFFVRRGYAIVIVDVRGTGASFGVSRYPWEAITVQDAVDILDWIQQQPWSNGRVAGAGVSYLGTTAELLLATRHPALKAVIPQFSHPDPYTDIAAPGGLFNQRFITAWTEMNEILDQNRTPKTFGLLMKLATRGVRPVSGPQSAADFVEAIQMHTQNGGVKDLEAQIQFRDEQPPQLGYSIDDQAVMRFRDALFATRVPVYGWASWMDAGTGNAALRRFLTLPGPQLAVLGAWNHGGMKKASPYRPANAPLSPPPIVQQYELLRFLEICLKQQDGAEQIKNTVYYYTLGGEVWQKSHTWPPVGVKQERWFFGPEGSLSTQQPSVNGEDHYTVDLHASTGTQNRWWELGVVQGKTVDYGNRAAQKPFVLGYESAPLEQDLEISGTPVINLYITSDTSDCAFYVYLEDVFPDGRIFCVTEGELRAIHRKVCPPQESVYRLQEPYHTFRKDDALPLVPGEMAEITLGLLPVSVLIKRGHRLRISLAGHDEGNFPRIPEKGVPTWRIARSARYPSMITLPVKRL